MNKKISIIVPVYNVEKFISECIESILDQTYTNFELLLVDDGSTDDSLALCENYAKKDSRIRVFHKENGGQGSARNLALDNITGEYVGFVDSDDLITPDMYEQMVKIIESTSSDMVVCERECFSYEVDLDIDNSNKTVLISMTPYEAMENRMQSGRYVNDGPCNKLYTAELLKNMRFIEGRLLEDTAFTYKLIHMCKKITYTNKIGYLIRLNPGSVSRRKYNVKRCDTIITFEEMTEFMKSHSEYSAFVPKAQALANGAVFYNAGEFYTSKTRDEKTKELIRRHAKKQLKEYKKISFKNKVLLWFIANSFCVYGLFYKISKKRG